MTIGSNIKAIRKERKLKQGELAKSMGISRSYLSDIENDRKNPSIKTLESLAEKLNVTVFYLTTGKKMISDLSEEKIQEVGKSIENMFSNIENNSQNFIKEEFENILSSELNYRETMYLANALSFLNSSDEEDVAFLTSFLQELNIDKKEGMEDDSLTKEEIKKYINLTLDNMRKFLEKRFNYKGGE